MNQRNEKYVFYYDETEHSRKINFKTISANNYYDNFITLITGWREDNHDFIERYLAFEEKHSDRKDANNELKSSTLKQKHFRYGFASLDAQNVEFVRDFLNLFDDDVHVYFTSASKIEYIVAQLIYSCGYELTNNVNSLEYGITKALLKYRPRNVIQAIYDGPDAFLNSLTLFFQERIEFDCQNFNLKSQEIAAYNQTLCVLNDFSIIKSEDWDYRPPFEGFKKYLIENDISNYSLIMDKEGYASKTLSAAHESGLIDVCEADSRAFEGIRVADLLAGIVCKLMKGLYNSLCYNSLDEGCKKKLLPSVWFNIDDSKLGLYKQLYRIICKWQPAYYKTYTSIYADDLVCFISLLRYMNQFESASQLRIDLKNHGEYFNGYVCEELEYYFKEIGLNRCL